MTPFSLYNQVKTSCNCLAFLTCFIFPVRSTKTHLLYRRQWSLTSLKYH